MMTAQLPMIGTPYRWPSNPPDSFCCWTLVQEVRNRLGLTSPLSINPADYAPDMVADAVALELRAGWWHATEQPRDGDLVLFNLDHVGVYVCRTVMHATPSSGVQVANLRAVSRRFPSLRVFTR